MKNFKRFVFSLVCLFFLTSNLLADNKVAYIDIDKILALTEPGKSLFKQLNILEKSEFDLIEIEEKKLKIEENKILATKSILSEEEYLKNVNTFKKMVLNHRNDKKKIIDNLKKKRNNEVIRFLKMTNPFIRSIMEKNSIEILIEKKNIFIAKSNTDITNSVIEIINNNIKTFKIEK